MVHLAPRPSRRVTRSTALGAAGVLLLALVVPGQQAPVAALGISVQIDAPADYEAQTSCRKAPRPGTVALAQWLRRAYPVTGSMGLMRNCRTGGASEHKDGRAFDWAADFRKKKTRKAAYRFIRRALATDSAGNEHALARRMGIMYMIYNDTIWASYRDFAPRPYLNSSCKTKRKCSRTLRHRDHVHISLGHAGAAAQTSWYRSRNVPSVPVLYPGTRKLDPDSTALTSIEVPATGALVTSRFLLRAGVTYRFVSTGTVRYAAGAVGDAHCIAAGGGWQPTDRLPLDLPLLRSSGWSGGWGHSDPPGSEHEDSGSALPLPSTHGLVLAGGLRWGDSCRGDHTYESWYTPLVNQRLQLKYVDAKASDNSGSLTVHVARDDITAASLVRR